MQKLFFEDAWDRTISKEDRLNIKKVFEQTKKNAEEGITFVPVRSAINHRNDLLIISLIHNFQPEGTNLTNITIQLFQGDRHIASRHIKEERLRLSAKTSMPWTFIFPEIGYENQHPTHYSLKVEH
ncbi:SLAP domain-containing protein [Gracilibacillus sp. S3-1-1]|uniref:SLAP domain-containing protein n=1 Tax=Gracilibacillus pellucidus TaxID=3095368 RepID=A0ACC6M7C1_9BACI|nr:SLAP domain-containing protein [Gracilibacillus sp. S3-1-1]MDX8046873.1 SLAP domain-containing protein [Gracilibacillus sp. S3-1-1]